MRWAAITPPRPPSRGVLFAREYPEHEVVLVGEVSRVRPYLGRTGAPSNLHLRHASEVVEKDSSLRVGFELVRDGEVSALVSAGNSGVERPAIEKRGGLRRARAGLQAELTRCIAQAAAWLPTRQRGKRATEDTLSD